MQRTRDERKLSYDILRADIRQSYLSPEIILVIANNNVHSINLFRIVSYIRIKRLSYRNLNI